jgi:hypothetical protein
MQDSPPFPFAAYSYHQPMESTRLPRFNRASPKARLQITERDREIVRRVRDYRFLRSSHIRAIIPGSSQHLLRRLQLLYHHGFLERPRAQIEYFHSGGSKEIVCGLGNKGAALLKRKPGAHPQAIRWSEKNRAVGRLFLEHAILVSDIMIAIELGCRKSGNIRLLVGDQLPVPSGARNPTPASKWNVKVDSRLDLGLVPDRVFALQFGEQSQNRVLCLLEADRGTMPVKRAQLSQSSFYRKMLAYAATWERGLYRTQFGFDRVRVLTVTASAERVQSMVKACSELHRGHGLFLFTDRETLLKHDDIFTLRWQSGRRGGTVSLLD